MNGSSGCLLDWDTANSLSLYQSLVDPISKEPVCNCTLFLLLQQFTTLLSAITYHWIYPYRMSRKKLAAQMQFLCQTARVISSTNQIIGFNNYIFTVGINDTKTFRAKYREQSFDVASVYANKVQLTRYTLPRYPMYLADFSSASFTLSVLRSEPVGGFSFHVAIQIPPSRCVRLPRIFASRSGIRAESESMYRISEARTLKATTDYSSHAMLAYCRAWKFDCASSSFNDQLSSRERVLPPTKTFLVVGRSSEDVWAYLPLGEVDKSINISLTVIFYNCVVCKTFVRYNEMIVESTKLLC